MRAFWSVLLLCGACSRPPGGTTTNTPDAAPAASPQDAGGDAPDAGEDAGTQPAPDAGTAHLIYITEANGYVHQVLPRSVEVLTLLGETHGFTLEHFADFSDAITPETLARADALVLYTTNDPPLEDAQKQLLLDYVTNGGGLVSLHSGNASMEFWPEYGVLTGARFRSHPWYQAVGVRMVEPRQDTTRGLPAAFQVVDEIYQFREFRLDLFTVVAELDTSTVDLNAGGVVVEPWGFPMAWQGPYGNGRVFCTALGHSPEAWEHADYRALVTAGIRWATRR